VTITIADPTFATAELRAALRSSAAGLTVVTTAGSHRFTSDAFTPVSLTPPVVLGSVEAEGARAIERNGAFAVNVLRPGVDWHSATSVHGATGSPLLLDAWWALDCELALTFAAGHEVIVMGKVGAVHAGGVAPVMLAA
jgi:flavin reductase (DIM6/NTAB) family NADH-FMN oxidoreductase RutF